MGDTIVILVNGEVLADSHKSSINDQKIKADELAEKLLPILTGGLKIALMHGNKPQVGYVLFRSEVASHILHPIPLDVCGADTQGATGYMLSQAILNVLRKNEITRHVMSVTTQTIVNSKPQYLDVYDKQIGPWLDQGRAKQRQQLYGWQTTEEPGYGFRRVVPSPPPVEIVEIEGVRQLIQSGIIVITAGGGGIPVAINENGELDGVEAVVDTDQVSCILASQLNAKAMLMIIENDHKFLSSGISTEKNRSLSLSELQNILSGNTITSNMVHRKLSSTNDYLRSGGEHVVISTLDKLSSTLMKKSGLWINVENPTIDLSNYF